MLIRVNLPKTLIAIIMSCASTVSTSILIKRGCLDEFYPTRGIRQGTNSFLIFSFFVWTILDNLLRKSVKEDLPSLIFSLLTILFSTIRDVLDYFCSIYGQTVSESKSRAYFFPNVDRDTRESLSDILYF